MARYVVLVNGLPGAGKSTQGAMVPDTPVEATAAGTANRASAVVPRPPAPLPNAAVTRHPA